MRAPHLVTVALVGALAMALLTVMVPDLTPATEPPEQGDAGAAREDGLVPLSPVLPASAFGDPYYDWAHLTAPVARAAQATTASRGAQQHSRITARLSSHTAPGR